MPWKYNKPGVGEARLYAIQKLLQNNLADLNAVVQYNAITSRFGSTYGDVKPEHVLIGDAEQFWKDPATNGFCRIYVSSAGHRNGQELSLQREYIDNNPRLTYTTDITIYTHNDIFRTDDANRQVLERQILLEVMADWLVQDVLMLRSNWSIPLTSQVYHNDGEVENGQQVNDTLYGCLPVTVSKGIFYRDSGNSVGVWGILVEHQSMII